MVPERNHLLVKYDNGATLAVFPEAETKFFCKFWPVEFEFSKNDKGEFSALTRRQLGKLDSGVEK
jgi:hypothetical protein